MENSTNQGAAITSTAPLPLWLSIIVGMVCSFIIICTVIGNALVCVSVCLVKRLRVPCNVLVVSLAVADLLVACLVMPPATAYELLGEWPLDEPLCDAWTCLDVLLCTASILNLCFISVDRYLAISRPFVYSLTQRTSGRMIHYVVGVWVLAALISIPPPLLGLNRAQAFNGQCVVSQSIGYQLFATVGSFYAPLVVMVTIYVKIYVTSERIARSDMHKLSSTMPLRAPSLAMTSPPACDVRQSPTLARCATTIASSSLCAAERNNLVTSLTLSPPSSSSPSSPSSIPRANSAASRVTFAAARHLTGMAAACRISLRRRRFATNTKSLLSKEHKAIRTLGIIMGAFVVCWLPFFVVALVRPFCHDPETCVSPRVTSLLAWLGYLNSLLNPIIYASFNRDFRSPFRDILLCRCQGINARQRFQAFSEQYGSIISSPSKASVQASPAVIRFTRTQRQ